MAETAGTIINDVAVELGLLPFAGKLTEPFASTDSNIGQLCQLMKSVGTKLRRERSWTFLQQTYTFSTVANQGTYALPPDFGAMIAQTGWNRTNRLPLGGPLSPQEWQCLKSRLVGVVFNVLFRPLDGSLSLFPDSNTPSGFALAFEYDSLFWAVPASTTATTNGPWNNGVTYVAGNVVSNGGRIYTCVTGGVSGASGPTGTGAGVSDGVCVWNYATPSGATFPTIGTDVVLFDTNLFSRALKLAWRVEKGFDASGAAADYDDALRGAASDDNDAPILSLNRRMSMDPLIGSQSIPTTGFGGGT